MKRHAATTERVWVEGKGTRAVRICSVCQAQVETAEEAEQHLWMEQVLNGHPECSMDQRVMTDEGRYETKRIPAWEESVVTGYWCPLCGAQRQA